MITSVKYQPTSPLMPARAEEARVIGYRRVGRKPPAVVLPVFIADESSDTLLLYQQGTSEGRIGRFIADPDLTESHVIRFANPIAETSSPSRVGEFMIHAYEYAEGKVIIDRGAAFRDRLRQLVIDGTFEHLPFAGLEIAQFTNDLPSEKSFAVKCTRDLMARSSQLALAWIGGENLSAEAKEVANSIIISYNSPRRNIPTLKRPHPTGSLIEFLRQSNPNHDDWAHLWLDAWTANRSKLLTEIGFEWLRTASVNHGGWASVWLELWRDAMLRSREESGLIELGKQWIISVEPDNKMWASVWKRLFRTLKSRGGGRSDLTEQALAWLSTVTPAAVSWSPVWRELLRDSQSGPLVRLQLKRLGRQWLERAPPYQASWGAVWTRLYKASSADEQEALIQVALQWLKTVTPKHASWVLIWTYLWDRWHGPGFDLQSAALSWLANAPPLHHEWHIVWKRLFDDSLTDASLRGELLRLGLAWLDRSGKRKIAGTAFTRPVLIEALRSSSNE
jgi:hypothetical protein